MKNKSTLSNPFPGLRSFRSDEDYLFFGRDEQTLELMARLERNRFIAVVGTSGRGKSSLVRCGLLSRLQGGGMVGAGAHWEIAVMHPGGHPLHHLAEALFESGLHDRAREDALPHLLATLGRSQFGLIEAVRQAALPVGTNFLLVVDQFEEIFRYDEAGEAESEVANDFIAMLREASAQTEVPIYIVTTMRSDFIGDCSRFEGLAEAVNRGEYLIPGLNRDQFKAAIEGPIRVAGGQIAPRLLQRLLNDLGEEQDQLPCLQHALMRTWRVWQGRADAPALDLEDYAQVGKMSQALSLHADEVYSGLATDRQRELCAAMFKALTVEGSEKRGIRRPRRLQTLCGTLGVEAAELTPIIDAFRHPEVSFLMPPSDVPLKDTTVIDLSHESLMRVWTRLRDWVDDEAKSVGIFRRLSESAALWREGKSGFYRDPELSIARAWVESSRPNATWAEQYDGNFEGAMAFLQASSDAAQEENRAHEAARQRELEQARALAEAERQRAKQQAQFAARLKWFVRGLGLVAMMALAAMLFAFAARREAQENATRAQTAERKAQAAGTTVDAARGQAEKLVSFLLDDFYEELEPTGRVDTVAKLAREAVAYFDGLPTELRSSLTRRNRAIALLRLGQAVHRSGRFDDGLAITRTALAELELLHAGGDRSEATVIGLAAALRAQIPADRSEVDASALANLERCIGLLRPLATASGSSVAVRVAFAEALHEFGRLSGLTVQTLNYHAEARDILAGAGALDGTNLKAASTYAYVTLGMAIRSRTVRRQEDSEKFYAEAVALADKVLAAQPGDLQALRVSGMANSYFTSTTITGDRNESWRRAVAAADAFELLVRFNPSDARAWTDLIEAQRSLGSRLSTEGKIDEALRYYRTAFETAKRQKSSAETLVSLPDAAFSIAQYEAWRGNRGAALEMLDEAIRLSRAHDAGRGVTGLRAEISKLNHANYRRRVLFHLADYEALCDEAKKTILQIDALEARPRVPDAQKRVLREERFHANADLGRGSVLRGRWAEAETALRAGLGLFPEIRDNSRLGGNLRTSQAWLVIALGKQGRSTDALDVLAQSDLTDLRKRFTEGDHTQSIVWRLARVVIGEAVAQSDDAAGRERRRDSLTEAKAALDGLSGEARDLNESRVYLRMIDEELAKLPAKAE
jgi:hypothetical protein